MLRLRILLTAFSVWVAVVAAGAFTRADEQYDKAPDTSSQHVLVLNSYHAGYEWSDWIMSAVRDAFQARMPSAELYFEYLDTKRFQWSDSLNETWLKVLSEKYAPDFFTTVICSDDNAYQFLLKYHERLWPGTPVVFCGINDFDPTALQNHPEFTGVLQTVDFAANARLIKKILPGTRTVYAVVDNSLTGTGYRKTLEQALPMPEGIEVRFLDGHELTHEQLLDRLGKLEKDSAVFFMIWVQDASGRTIPTPVGHPQIAAASSVPVFQASEGGFGRGFAGGVMVTPRSQGARAAHMAMDIMDGRPVSETGVVSKGEFEQRLDWAALGRRWGVDRAAFIRREAELNGTSRTVPTALTGPFKVCIPHEAGVAEPGGEKGSVKGLGAELLSILSRAAGAELIPVPVEPSQAMAALRKAECDALIPLGNDRAGGIEIELTEHPLFSTWGTIYTLESLTVSSIRDLSGRKIAVLSDSVYAVPLVHQLEDLGIPASIVWTDSYDEALDLLVDGKVDAAVVGRFHRVSSGRSYPVQPTGILIEPAGQRIAVLKGRNRTLLDLVDSVLPALKTDPAAGYQETIARYTFSPTVVKMPRWVWLLLAALGISVMFVVVLRFQVNRRTAALRDREENLRVTLDSIGDAVIVADRRQSVTRMNPVASALTGWSQLDAIGQPLTEVLKTRDSETGQNFFQHADTVMQGTTGNDAMHREAVLVPKTGREKRIEYSAAPIRERGGGASGVIIVFRDITEERRRQEMLRQSQKMEAIGQLAGGIAHDFNNVLGGIVGIAEFLSSRYRTDETVTKYCGHIVDSGRRAATMTRRLLDFARLGKGESVPMSLNAAVASAVELLKGSLPRNIELEVGLNAVHDIVIGDAAQIENMVLNLCINARDAMPEGGRLTVGTSNPPDFREKVEQGPFLLAPGPYVAVSVSDTGIGMSAEVLERIFEPFFTTKGLGSGTGLGLAAVTGIVGEHQGGIEVESEAGSGSVFRVFLPVTGAGHSTAGSGGNQDNGRCSGTVLVIDDEPVIRMMAEGLLTQAGFNVLTAADGREGAETYRRRHAEIDVVLLDFIMPVMDGLATLSELKSINPGVRVVIASGFTNDHKKQTFIEAGAVDAVAKPFSKAEICSVLNQATGRSV